MVMQIYDNGIMRRGNQVIRFGVRIEIDFVFSPHKNRYPIIIR